LITLLKRKPWVRMTFEQLPVGYTSTEDEENIGEVVTMVDVLEDGKVMEENAKAVLGGASETVCSYGSGYVPRQPLYACTTCSQPSNPSFQPAGVCLACSYKCHEGHALIELYTKRNFRCDCGPRLGQTCKLLPVKEDNEKNVYNQNFSGVYCECSRPYPDPEDPVDDCMVQCVVCEDWFHGRHLGLDTTPEDSSYAEMICRGCVKKHNFLANYAGLSVTKEKKDVSAVGTDQETTLDVETPEAGTGEAEPSPKPPTCPLGLPAGDLNSLFLPIGWRKQVCQCLKCVNLFKEAGIAFLTDETDTVHHYEEKAKESQGDDASIEEAGMEALGQMGRVQQVEAIHSYNAMKDNLMEYLAKFANSKKVVREEDIKEFFEGMKKNKKMKAGGPPPSSCK